MPFVTPSTKSPETIESYLQNVLYNLSIQPNDALFRKTLEINVPKSYEGLINGDPQNFDSLLKLTLMHRQNFSSIVITKQEFVVVPKDSEGKTGTAFHGFDLDAVQNGKLIKAKARCLFEVGLMKGHRIIEGSDCVTVVL